MKNLYQMTNPELKQYISQHRNDEDAFHAAMKVVMSRRDPDRRHPYPLELKNPETEVEAILREKLAPTDLQFTQFQQMFADEAKDGPRLFSFQPIEPGFFDRPKWMIAKFQLTLWCEHSRRPVPALNPPGDKRGVYELELPRKWLVKAKPFLKLMTTTLILALPVATKVALDEAAYAAMKKELQLGQKTLDDATREGGDQGHDESEDVPMRAEGAVLRELHAILKAKDPTFGGLVRVQNKRREFLWVHPQFQYDDEYS